MERMRRAAWAFAAIVVGACSTNGPTQSPGGGTGSFPASTSAPPSLSPAGIELPTYGLGNDYPAALATGTLERRESCVVLHVTIDVTIDWLLIWPTDTTASLDEGSLVITEPVGPALHEHQQISVGGGDYTEADFPRPITGLVDACRSYRLWLAAPP